MPDHSDLSYWEMAYGAVAGLVAGAGTIMGVKRKARADQGNRVRSEIRTMQDSILSMEKDIHHMQEAHKAQQATMERMEHEHDVVIAELFREIKNIGLSLREVAVEVRFALQNNNKGEGH